ncbi:MAG: ParB/RepB/Spo0J family partition protein [Oscillospiraceae bacterium]
MNIDPKKLGKKPTIASDDFLTAMFSPAAGGTDVKEISIALLTPWSDAEHDRQPFRPYTPEKLAEMAENIAQVGVLSPVFLRPLGSGYQILAGHNRVEAAKMAGLLTVPAIVRSVDDDTAKEILTATNLHQRETLLPSEKAFAYKMRMDAEKRQGKRSDLTSSQLGTKLNIDKEMLQTSSQVGTKLRADEKIALETGESRNQIARYIRLTFLVPALLNLVDDGSVPFIAGESVSYLTPEQQQLLLGIMGQHDVKKLTNNQAGELKSLRDELSAGTILDILGIADESTPKTVKPLVLKIELEDTPANVIKRLGKDDRLHAKVEDLVYAYLKEQTHE